MKLIRVCIGVVLASLPFSVQGQVLKGLPVVEAMTDYRTAGEAVAVDGARRIHLRCMGQGAPVVVFTAGLGSWSGSWAKVQPEVAMTTRACAWDRAGFGLSNGDPGTPQTIEATTHDLERALAKAGVEGPYVMVGQSAGAHEVLTFTDRRPRDVAGVVLVDPVRPHDMARQAAAGPRATAADRAFYAGEVRRLRDCAAGVEAGAVKTGAPAEPCFQYYPEIPKPVQAALARLDADPARLRTQASSYEEYEPNGERVVRDDRRYGDLPLIVLSAGSPGLWTDEAKDEHAALLADWRDSHRSLADLSKRGQVRVVKDSGHLVPYERPQAVIDAVRDVVKAARAARPRPGR